MIGILRFSVRLSWNHKSKPVPGDFKAPVSLRRFDCIAGPHRTRRSPSLARQGLYSRGGDGSRLASATTFGPVEGQLDLGTGTRIELVGDGNPDWQAPFRNCRIGELIEWNWLDLRSDLLHG